MILNDYVVRGDASAIHTGVLGVRADASVAAPKPTWDDAFKSGQIARSIQAFDRSNHDTIEGRHTPHENGVTPQNNDVLPRDKQELRRGPVRPQPRPNNLRAARTKN